MDIQFVEPEVNLVIRLSLRLQNTSPGCFLRLLGLVGVNLALTYTPQSVSHLLPTDHTARRLRLCPVCRSGWLSMKLYYPSIPKPDSAGGLHVNDVRTPVNSKKKLANYR
jgi:hypothetical protein